MWLLCSPCTSYLPQLSFPVFGKRPFPHWLPSPKPPLPWRRDLHDSRLGALAVGFIVILHKAARQLPGDVGEAAGGWWVRGNCEGKTVMSSGKGWGTGWGAGITRPWV